MKTEGQSIDPDCAYEVCDHCCGYMCEKLVAKRQLERIYKWIESSNACALILFSARTMFDCYLDNAYFDRVGCYVENCRVKIDAS